MGLQVSFVTPPAQYDEEFYWLADFKKESNYYFFDWNVQNRSNVDSKSDQKVYEENFYNIFFSFHFKWYKNVFPFIIFVSLFAYVCKKYFFKFALYMRNTRINRKQIFLDQ